MVVFERRAERDVFDADEHARLVELGLFPVRPAIGLLDIALP
jgi:hypothetical protein